MSKLAGVAAGRFGLTRGGNRSGISSANRRLCPRVYIYRVYLAGVSVSVEHAIAFRTRSRDNDLALAGSCPHRVFYFNFFISLYEGDH